MDIATTTVKNTIRRVPLLHRFYLNLITLSRYLRYRIHVDDDCHLKDEWDFSTPAEQARHKDALFAARSVMGRTLGDVLEVGCHAGHFSVQVAPWASSVTAIDVSEEGCRAAATRCSDFSNTSFHTVNILKDAIPGKFDVVFVMCVLCYLKGKKRLNTVSGKFYQSLRENGLLVIQEMRLIPEVEGSFWAKWLGEGAFHICDYFERQTDFRLLEKNVHGDHVTAVFQKPATVRDKSLWRRLVPRPLKAAYRRFRIFWRLRHDRDEGRKTLSERYSMAKRIAASSSMSLIQPHRLEQLLRHIVMLERERIPGDFVECGVYRGGSALILGQALGGSAMPRNLWLFDSFEGLPPSGEKDGPSAAQMSAGRLKTDKAEVEKLLFHHGIPAEKTFIVPGWFSDTLHQAPIKTIALLHIDGDWYSSVKQCLHDLYPLVSSGGIVILDDYDEWPGCKTAVDEFLREQGKCIVLEGGGGVPYYFRKHG